MIISFSRTTAALQARAKSVTRREWTDRHAAKFKPGDLVDAWSASPHRGGRPIGVIRIVRVTKEPTRLIPDSDWKAEGFAYMAARGLNVSADLTCEQLWKQWRRDRRKVTWVIRFAVVRIYRKECSSIERSSNRALARRPSTAAGRPGLSNRHRPDRGRAARQRTEGARHERQRPDVRLRRRDASSVPAAAGIKVNGVQLC